MPEEAPSFEEQIRRIKEAYEEQIRRLLSDSNGHMDSVREEIDRLKNENSHLEEQMRQMRESNSGAETEAEKYRSQVKHSQNSTY